MSDINFDIDKIVQFARISLSDDDKKNLESSLRSIIEYINKLMKVNVDGVEPSAHAFPLCNVLREDEVSESFSQEVALQNAPKQRNNLLIVPKVVE